VGSLIINFSCKFAAECVSERSLIIWPYLTKLLYDNVVAYLQLLDHSVNCIGLYCNDITDGGYSIDHDTALLFLTDLRAA